MDRKGYRKVKRHKPNLQQWLRVNEKSETVRHIHAYHDAVERGDVETVVEHVPLDMSKESDRVYLMVQKKRMNRRQAEERR